MFQNIDEKEANYITESKKRCRDLGMDPNVPNLPKNIMSESELAKKKEEYKEILDVISFFGGKIIKSLQGISILIGISDENGYGLDILGEEAIKSTVDKLEIKVGIQYIEEHVGTNVVSLTLKQNHPVQLVGTDHYHKHLHNSACYGVPFYDSDNNKLLGSICIMIEAKFHNSFFLMILSTVVDAIERELLLRKQNRKINRQQELLYQSEKKQREILEKDLIMKDEFITLITHEFKTPINVIYSAIQLIEHVYINKVPESVKKLIASIKLNTLRQLRIANNLLDINRLNSNQFELRLKKVDVVLLTRSIVESVKIYSDQKKVNLKFKSNISSKNIILDDEKYERIILNLLSNAIKFTPNGGSITVKVEENIDCETINISVIDNGVGIPKEKYEKIFEKFGQVRNNLSRQTEGSGIGLALVKMLIATLGGEIQVESELDLGSTFTITLPIKEEIEDKENQNFIDPDGRIINSVNVEFSDIYF